MNTCIISVFFIYLFAHLFHVIYLFVYLYTYFDLYSYIDLFIIYLHFKSFFLFVFLFVFCCCHFLFSYSFVLIIFLFSYRGDHVPDGQTDPAVYRPVRREANPGRPVPIPNPPGRQEEEVAGNGSQTPSSSTQGGLGGD